jgi:hypothetical protein
MTTQTEEKILSQYAALTAGAAVGVVTKHASTSLRGPGALAAQVGSAIGAAAASGAGLSGSVAAGGAVVAAKVAVVSTLGSAAVVAAAPFAMAAGAGYGFYLLLKKLNDN